MTLSSTQITLETKAKEYLAGNADAAIQQEPSLILSAEIASNTTKRTREDDTECIEEDSTTNKRLRTYEDVPPLLNASSPEIEIRFPDLENELFTPLDTNTTDIMAPGFEDWFLPNSPPICEFDLDPVLVPDSDNNSYTSDIPYFEHVELQILPDSDINSKAYSLDSEDTQFWSLLTGDGEHS